MLSVRRVSAGYGLLQAVRGVSFELAAGETLALVGANGAGKTTLLRVIAGAMRPFSGEVHFMGHDVTALPAHERVKRGIALVPEGRRVFPGLTVAENLEVAAGRGRSGPWTLARLYETFPQLAAKRKARAETLSGGQQQALAIARALLANPSLLLLDEVSLGLSPAAVDQVYAALTPMLGGELTVILVEQDLERALGVADRVICLLEGSITHTGPARGADRAEIMAAYFGSKGSAKPS
jgi:branched-chain amino acid transport system ATP-binding protein